MDEDDPFEKLANLYPIATERNADGKQFAPASLALAKHFARNVKPVATMLSPELEKKIPLAAFQMFRDWTDEAQEEFPKLDFTILDESVLVENLYAAFRNGAEDLLKVNRSEEAKRKSDFDLAFSGYASKKLDALWMHAYIRRRTDEYKIFALLGLACLYFNTNEHAMRWVHDEYMKAMGMDRNFERFDPQVEPVDLESIRKSLLGLRFEPPIPANGLPILTALEKPMMDYGVRMLKFNPKLMQKSIGEYFTPWELRELRLHFEGELLEGKD